MLYGHTCHIRKWSNHPFKIKQLSSSKVFVIIHHGNWLINFIVSAVKKTNNYPHNCRIKHHCYQCVDFVLGVHVQYHTHAYWPHAFEFKRWGSKCVVHCQAEWACFLWHSHVFSLAENKSTLLMCCCIE